MKNTKLLVFLFSLSGGGAERTVVNLINNLDSRLFNITLIIGSHKNNDYLHLINKNVKVEFLGRTKLRHCLIPLIKYIRSAKPDLLFSTINANNIMLLIAKLLSFTNVPVVVREANNRTQSGKVSKLNRYATKVLYNKVSRKVIALSNGVKQDLIRNFSVKSGKIQVIYNPVEIDLIEDMSKENVLDYNLKKNEKLIVSVGRLVEQKDYYTLLKSFKKISSEINARLFILGKGPLENKLKQFVFNLNLEGRVEFLGFKKNPYKYMRLANVFVLSSKWEGFGHVIVESMATGTPVISTDCNSGPQEIIQNNKYGKLSPVEDAEMLAQNMLQILTDEKLAKYYSIQGKRRAKDFKASVITKEYEDLFKKSILY